jgi:two-component system sensor histidine kinase/response regulator
MNDHLVKPIELAAMWKALGQWVRPRPGLGVARAAAPSGDGMAGRDAAARADLLPLNVPGLDAEAGLRRVAGKLPMYLELLRRFAATQRDVPDRVRESLARADEASARRAVHTLKGLAGQIGASGVQWHAQALETVLEMALGEGDLQIVEGSLVALEPALAALVSAIESRLAPSGEEKPASVEVDAARLASVCSRLGALLAAFDAEAADVLEAESGLLRVAFPRHHARIRQGIDAFDFDTALAALREAQAECELNEHG